jgi:tRNA(adenine34) deaminase
MDETWMAEALALARRAAVEGEVPVGAVVVCEGRVVGTGRNARERLQDPTAHAEVLALKEASAALSRWRLTGCTLYVTLEPCFMCAGALVNARVDRLVFAVRDPKAGAVVSLAQVGLDARLNHRVEVSELAESPMAAGCSDVLKIFFRERRKPKPG